MPFAVNLSALPAPQRTFWPELAATPEEFTLYGGTALALRLGHRASVDFDFFTNASFDPERLAEQVPYLKESERIQLTPDTLTRLTRAVEAVNLARLPVLTPYTTRPEARGIQP